MAGRKLALVVALLGVTGFIGLSVPSIANSQSQNPVTSDEIAAKYDAIRKLDDRADALLDGDDYDYKGALPLKRRVLDELHALGTNDFGWLSSLHRSLATIYQDLGQPEQEERQLKAGLADMDRFSGTDLDQGGIIEIYKKGFRDVLGEFYNRQRKSDVALQYLKSGPEYARALEADGRYREAEAEWTSIGSKSDLAAVLAAQGRWVEAIRLTEAIQDEERKTSTSFDPEEFDRLFQTLESLANQDRADGKPDKDTEQMLSALRQTRAAQIAASENAKSQPQEPSWKKLPAPDVARLGRWYLRAGYPEKAVPILEQACKSEMAEFNEMFGVSMPEFQLSTNDNREVFNSSRCKSDYSQSLLLSKSSDRARALSEAFLAAQDVIASQPGVVMSRKAGRELAIREGASEEINRLEALQPRLTSATRNYVDKLNVNYNNAAEAKAWMGDLWKSTASFSLAAGKGKQVLDGINKRSPRFAALASNKAIDLNSLQGPAGLLRDREAIVLWMLPEDDGTPIVFAISKHRAAWAEIPMSTDQITATVETLRNELDPCGYNGFGAGCDAPARPFNKKLSGQLFEALLNAPAIREVIGDPTITSLMVVPSGKLSSFPPAALVTSATAMDTKWLVDRYAISILPTLSILRLRQIQKTNTEKPVSRGRFWAMANPTFGSTPPNYCSGKREVTHEEGALPAASANILKKLCPLPETAREVQSIAAKIPDPQNVVLLGADATEDALHDPLKAASLARARFVSFASHGLLGGTNGFDEPAIALSAPTGNSREDGLLTASEIAKLKLSAKLVLLTACNTAAPKTEGEQSLTGLAQGFLSAGAESLLVTHWRVQDKAASDIAISLFQNLNDDGRNVSAATALQRAMIELKSSNGGQMSEPSIWAAFTVVGAP